MVEMKIKHIKKVTSNGCTYYYDRISGKRIHAPFGTADFLGELEILRTGIESTTPTPPPAGTFGSMVTAYRMSPEFAGLAPRTRKDYARVFDFLKSMRHVPVSGIDQPGILKIRNKANEKHKRRFANYVVEVTRLTFSWGCLNGYADNNPGKGVPLIKRPKGLAHQNRAWTDDELDTVLKAATPPIAQAVAIGVYTGLREGDTLALALNAIRDGVIEWRQSKTGEMIEIPVHKKLAPYIEAARKREKRKGLTVIVGHYGRPYTGSGFRSLFFRLIRDLEKENKIGKGLTFHGLRHTVGTNLADTGADDLTIQTILGQKSTVAAQRYRRDANKKKRAVAAIKLLERPRKKNKK